MKKLLIALAAASLLMNFLSVRDCIRQREAYKRLDEQMKLMEEIRDKNVAELQSHIDSLIFQIADYEKTIDSDSIVIADLEDKYKVATAETQVWKKKFADSNSIDDCVGLVNSLELDLSIKCKAYNKLFEDFNLCMTASAKKDEIIGLKDEQIDSWKVYCDGIEASVQALKKAAKGSEWVFSVGLQGGVSTTGDAYAGVGFSFGYDLRSLFGKR